MRSVRLREIAERGGLIGGPFGSNLVTGDYTPNGIPVIRGENMSKGKWVSGAFVCVTPEKLRRDLSRNTAEPGDLVFTQRGTLGQVAMVPNEGPPQYVISQSQMRLRVDPTVAVAEYIYYACGTKAFLDQIDARAIATGVPHINLGVLGETEVPLPPFRQQLAIAEVLGALDDKIAANRRVALSAGELAATIFRWLQPVDTRSTTYEAVADVFGGGTPSTKVAEYWGGTILWVTPTDVTALPAPYLDRTDRMITREGFDACASALHPVGSILMTSRATIGAFAIAKLPLAVNQGFIVANAKNPAHQWWLFHEMQTRVGDYVAHANGATFLELSRGRFKAMEVEWPIEESVFGRFAAQVEVLHDRAYRAVTESRRLAHVRDTLLPHLMSGRIGVRAAEALAAEVL